MKQVTTAEMIRFRSDFEALRKKYINTPDYSLEEQNAAMDIIDLVDDFLENKEGN